MSNKAVLTGQEYRTQSMLELEQQMKNSLSGRSFSTEAHFRRVGLPILTGLLDDTFNEKAWIEYVGSAHVAFDIVTDDELRETVFTLPALMYIGPSLITPDDEISLTSETTQLMLQAGGANIISDEAVGQLILQTTDGIDEASYKDNVIRAKQTIDNINAIFARYGIKGSIDYPEGLLNAYNEVTGGVTAASKTAPAAKPAAPTYDFNAGEDL